jgi:hypothetical protein
MPVVIEPESNASLHAGLIPDIVNGFEIYGQQSSAVTVTGWPSRQKVSLPP